MKQARLPEAKRKVHISRALQDAITFHRQGLLDQAARHYEQILAKQPDHFDAKHLLGALRSQQGRNREALELIRAALQTNPNSASALSNLGLVLGKLGRPEEALASYDKALAIKPAFADALNNRGNALRELQRAEEALASYEKALAIKPDSAEALNGRGAALNDLRRPEEALASCDKALAIKPDFTEALNNRGNALRVLQHREEALASFDKALAIKPDSSEALNGRGAALNELQRPEEALASFDKALAIKPDFAEALNNRGNALLDLRRLEEAVASYDKALAIKPDYAEAAFNRGMLALLLGNFPSGWMNYEKRWDRSDAAKRKLNAPYPIWKGEGVSGKRIIVYEEQGLGDVIQFCRYLAKLSELGARVTFLVGPSLHRLLNGFIPAIRLTDKEPAGEDFDYQCALLSLPGAFGTTLESIPADIPYLRPEPESVAKWRERIGGHGLKVGICWQGSPSVKVDIGRSIPLQCFGALSAIPHVRLVSLQKEHGLDQLARLGAELRIETLGSDFDIGADAFIDTAAVMSCLDLIVTSDTSIAHLAGALGRPVWVALKWVPDWRWMLDRSDSPWYPTMTLYRQSGRDTWGGVFEQIAGDAGSKAGLESRLSAVLKCYRR